MTAESVSEALRRSNALSGLPVALRSLPKGIRIGLLACLSNDEALVLTSAPWPRDAELMLTLFGVEPIRRVQLRAWVAECLALAAGVSVLTLEVSLMQRSDRGEVDRMKNALMAMDAAISSCRAHRASAPAGRQSTARSL